MPYIEVLKTKLRVVRRARVIYQKIIATLLMDRIYLIFLNTYKYIHVPSPSFIAARLGMPYFNHSFKSP